MTNINISLVGGQTYPVYVGIVEKNFDKIIFVHSDNSKEEVERISREVKVQTEYALFDPVNLKNVFSKAEKMAESLSSDNEYTINITSGTKVWAVVFYEIFNRFENVEFIYVDQNNTIYNLKKNIQYQAKAVLDTNLVFRLNGTSLIDYNNFSDYTIEDEKVCEQIKVFREIDHTEFNELTIPSEKYNVQLESHNNGKIETEKGNFIAWNKKECLVSLTIKNRKGNNKSKKFNSLHVINIVFFSGWFEYEIAEMLSHWKYAKEILMNVKFPYKDKKTKNEIDIILNTGERLLFVECKTQITNITDIDKFRTAVKNYGGMGCKALFITEATMKDTTAEKCKDSDIICFSLQDCGNLIEPQKALFMKIETELFEINKK